MKRIYLIQLCIVIFAAGRLFGQKSYPTDSGSITLSGCAYILSQGGDMLGDDRSTVIRVNPSIGYFIIQNLAIGGTIDYYNISHSGDSNSSWGLGPKVSYYFGNRNTKLFPFISGSCSYTEWIDNLSRTNFIFTAGIASMIAKNVAITGSVYYLNESIKYEDESDSSSGNTIGLSFGVSVFVF